MNLHKLKSSPGSRTPRRRIGRGEGSTLGQTAGRGQKGQGSRAGDSIMNGFEGGQTPLMRRIPKRGFNNANRINFRAVNLGMLEARFESGTEINGKFLHEKGILKKPDEAFKILAEGKLTKSFKITAPRASAQAEKVIKKAGGSFERSAVN